ncbi:MAG TPA: alpha/beta hydrolase [Actinomycetota bacterium]
MRRTALLLLILVAACGRGATPEPGEVIRFETSDGVELVGELRGRGTNGVVLGHMYGSSREAWAAFAQQAAEAGYLTLAFDLRGFGESGGTSSAPDAPTDLRAAVEAIREHGAREVVVIGASFSGTGALVAAGEEEWAGVVTLSAPASFEGLRADAAVVEAVDEPKLFIAAQGDGSASGSAQGFYQAASGAKRVEIVVGDEHGTDLLESPRAQLVRDLLMAFLRAQLS